MNKQVGTILEYTTEKESIESLLRRSIVVKTDPSAYHCSVEAAIDIVGGKHKVLILWHLSKHGVLRFGELQRLMPQATPKMLTQQLRELEADGMLHRELYHQVPPKTEYSLTERGRSFVPILNALCAWGGEVLGEVAAETTAPARKGACA